MGSTGWLANCSKKLGGQPRSTMPQEISVSYLAIKSKVYRLIDALVDGEKTEADVQGAIHRWWELIHPADRPVARKYLLTVLGHSGSALDAIGDAFASSKGYEATYGPFPSERVRMPERIEKDARVGSAV